MDGVSAASFVRHLLGQVLVISAGLLLTPVRPVGSGSQNLGAPGVGHADSDREAR